LKCDAFIAVENISSGDILFVALFIEVYMVPNLKTGNGKVGPIEN
jgi:hypothetical protein